MANIFEINRVSNKITLGTTGTIINIASHTASRLLALDTSKNLEVVTIGSSLDYTRPTLNTIQDIRTSATPLFAGIIIADGGTIGQSAGPLLTFNDTSNLLEITGCELHVAGKIQSTRDSNTLVEVLKGGNPNTGNAAGVRFSLSPYGSNFFLSAYGDNHTTKANTVEIGSTATGTSLHFVTEGVLRLFVMSDGKIGAGVEPKTKLTVEGTITLKEQAAADGDTAAYGQLWVKTATPNEFMFTDDAGTDMLIAPLAYGEISVVGNAVETAIASQNVYVQVTVFDTNGENFKVTPDHTNDHNTIVKAGRYFISCSITLNSVGGAGSTAEMEVKKNNGTARVGSLHVDRTLSGGGTESGAITITGIANLAVDDTIEVWIKNETNTQNYVVEDITLSLIQIGGA